MSSEPTTSDEFGAFDIAIGAANGRPYIQMPGRLKITFSVEGFDQLIASARAVQQQLRGTNEHPE